MRKIWYMSMYNSFLKSLVCFRSPKAVLCLYNAFGAENDSFVGFASRAIKDLVRELQYGFQGPVPRKSG